MNQRLADHALASPGMRVASSGGGAPALPRSHFTGLTETCVTFGGVRTLMSASPGTTPGGRTTTRTAYGPALPSKNDVSVPTCAKAGNAISTQHAARSTLF